MEKWESLLEEWPATPDVESVERAVQAATDMLTDDLAPFEIDWFLESLLAAPVALLQTVRSRHGQQDAWAKLHEKAFLLLSGVVDKFDNARPYYEDIENLCGLWYPARARARALACLAALARRHPPAAGAAAAQHRALADNTCRAERVQLLGVLCEHWPELVPEAATLWRSFLALLLDSKISMNLAGEVLWAVSRLLQNFGSELAPSELNELYEKIKEYIKTGDSKKTHKCHAACCVILEKYSGLFKEKVSADAKFRSYLWAALSEASRPALLAVYRTCLEGAASSQEITQELVDKSASDQPLTKFTALRLLGGGRTLGEHADPPRLEALLRAGAAHDHLEAIWWCISSGVVHSARLVRAAARGGPALPGGGLARALLAAPADTRQEGVEQLAAAWCGARGEEARAWLRAEWRALLRGGALPPALRHAADRLHAFLHREEEELPLEMSELLELVAFLLDTQEAGEGGGAGGVARAVRSCVRSYPGAAGLRAARALAARGHHMDDLYESIDLTACVDDEHLEAACGVLLAAGDAPGLRPAVLQAAQVVLSRSGAAPALRSAAVRAAERLLAARAALAPDLLHEVIFLVEKIRAMDGGRSRQHRELHRDAVMFLSKYGSNEIFEKGDSRERVVTTRLKELRLDIPDEGTVLKLELGGALRRALAAGDCAALRSLLAVMRAHWGAEPSPDARAALCRTVAALARHEAGAVAALAQHEVGAAAALCGEDGAHLLLAYAEEETSPRARGVLLGAVGGQLARAAQQQAARLADGVLAAARRSTSQTKLDVLATLVAAMERNNTLSQRYLPRALALTLETRLAGTGRLLDDAAQMFVDKMSLFEGEDALAAVVRAVVDTVCDERYALNNYFKRVTRKAVAFVNNLYDLRRGALPSALEVCGRAVRGAGPRALYALAELRGALGRDLQFGRDLLMFDDKFIEQFFGCSLVEECALDAVLCFISTFSDVLLEAHCERTLEKLSECIAESTPAQIIYGHRNLSRCVIAVTGGSPREIPAAACEGARAWAAAAARRLGPRLLAGEERACALDAEALAHIVDTFGAAVPPGPAADWLTLVRGITPDDTSDKDDECLSDLVHVCLAVLPPELVRDIVCGDDTEGALSFCRTYIGAFSEFWTREPSVLRQAGWGALVGLLSDAVRHAAARRPARLPALLRLLDEVWPAFEASSDLQQKLGVLQAAPPPAAGSRARWLQAALAADTTAAEDKVRLVALLPGGDACSESYVSVARTLPARLSELRAGAACALQALLANCARTRDPALLGLLARLAAEDSSKEWWEQAFDDCMRELASGAQLELVQHVYRLCGDSEGCGACDRLLVPLLSHISPCLCEEFFSSVLEELFAALRQQLREGAFVPCAVRRAALAKHTNVFNVLRVAFERIPRQRMESPQSVLYRAAGAGGRRDLLPVTVLVHGQRLRACPAATDAALAETCRLFRCAVFNCMARAACCWAVLPAQAARAVLDPAAWRDLVDPRRDYRLPLADRGKHQGTRQQVSMDVAVDAGPTSASASGPSRAHFLRTLSEDPFLYDMPATLQKVQGRGAVQGAASAMRPAGNLLMDHECAASLVALVRHVAAGQGLACHDALLEGLRPRPGHVDTNARWLIAQVVCSCQAELRPAAAALRPALLELVADAPDALLNGLHLQILDVIIDWREEVVTAVDVDHLDRAVLALVTTAREEAARRGVVAALLHTLERVVAVYGPWLTAAGRCWDAARERSDSVDDLPLKILKIFAANKVDLRKMAERFLGVMEVKAKVVLDMVVGPGGVAGAVPRALGVAAGAGAAGDGLEERFRGLAERLRTAGQLLQYVPLVYHAQRGWPACCDHDIARNMAELAGRLPGAARRQCLAVLADHLARAARSPHVAQLIDTLDIPRLLGGAAGGCGREERRLAAAALRLLTGPLRRRVALQLAADARAAPLLPAALEAVVSSEAESEPPCKRRPGSSALLSAELRPLVAGAARALAADGAPALAALLASDHALRFCEALALAVYHPLLAGAGAEAGGDAARLLELLLRRVRSQEGFQGLRLTEEPLNFDSGSAAPAPSTSAGSALTADASATPADGRAPLDDVLASILQFAKRQPAVAVELCVQAARGAVRGAARGAGAAAVGGLLRELLQRRRATPLVLQLCRVYLDACCTETGFPEAVEELAGARRWGGGEGRALLAALRHELQLRTAGPRLFQLGCDTQTEDASALDADREFSLRALVNSFGSLAHWERRSSQQRAAAARAAPALWADHRAFRAALRTYVAGEDWFGSMVGVAGGARGAERGLARADRWPRDSFDVAAMAEAVEWRRVRESSGGAGGGGGLRWPDAPLEPEHCLAKWAARLMLRRVFLKSVEVESQGNAGGEEEARGAWLAAQLQWCARANHMELPAAALRCLQDLPELREDERPPWTVQKVLALRTMGLQRRDRAKLEEALRLAERARGPAAERPAEPALAAARCRLLLLQDLDRLTPDNITGERELVRDCARLAGLRSAAARASLDAVRGLVATCLYDHCADDVSLLRELCGVLDAHVSLGAGRRARPLADMVLQRATERPALPPDVAAAVAHTLGGLRHELDEVALELAGRAGLLVGAGGAAGAEGVEGAALHEARRLLALVADPAHCLLHYVQALLHAADTKDAASWAEVFARMKAKMFENEHAGPDYRVLHQHRRALYEMEQYDECSSGRRRAELGRLAGALQAAGGVGGELRLPQLCPALCGRAPRPHRALAALLRLPDDEEVHFDETVHVYTKSLRRAALLTVRGTGRGAGGVRRYIVKSGESLRCDAAALRCHEALTGRAADYWVTPLAADCGLIEYLEQHETVRALLAAADTDGTLSRAQPGGQGGPGERGEGGAAPATFLRCAIENNSISLDDFLWKTRRFTESLCDVTVVSWLLGVGDRHLENLMYGLRHGALVAVDWGSLGQHGRREPPPARLTRCLLAAADLPAVEARLQRAVRRLRAERAAVGAALHVALAWCGASHQALALSAALAAGRALPPHETRALRDAVCADVPAGPAGERYTVEDQVRCLLRQCTDPRVLAATRAAWEPWL